MENSKVINKFYLDKEKDIIVNLYKTNEDELTYILETPNHGTGNLITNLAKICNLETIKNEKDMKIIKGTIPASLNGDNEEVYIFRLGGIKIANIYTDGRIEIKATIPAISKTLMSQTKNYNLDINQTLVKSYILKKAKFRTDLHTHMNANLSADCLIALGIKRQVRYPLYYIKKLDLKITKKQEEKIYEQRKEVEKQFENSELQGKLKENTQLGCELINDDSVEADAEILALVVDSLKAAGLKEFLVEIGHADFYKGLLEECGFDTENEQELRKRIENKNYFGVEEILDNNNITGQLKEAFLKLPELFGSIDVIKSAKELTDNKKALQSIERLEKLYSILEDYGVSKYISFDLGMISNFNYYTGIIFKAYTYGSGDQIVAGGRYDKLLGQFGKEAAAVGFAVYMDQILLAVNGQLLKENNDYSYEVIIYDPEFRKAALSLTNALRDQGVKTELISKKENISLDEYTTFKKEDGATKITYVSKDGAVEL